MHTPPLRKTRSLDLWDTSTLVAEPRDRGKGACSQSPVRLSDRTGFAPQGLGTSAVGPTIRRGSSPRYLNGSTTDRLHLLVCYVGPTLHASATDCQVAKRSNLLHFSPIDSRLLPFTPFCARLRPMGRVAYLNIRKWCVIAGAKWDPSRTFLFFGIRSAISGLAARQPRPLLQDSSRRGKTEPCSKMVAALRPCRATSGSDGQMADPVACIRTPRGTRDSSCGPGPAWRLKYAPPPCRQDIRSTRHWVAFLKRSNRWRLAPRRPDRSGSGQRRQAGLGAGTRTTLDVGRHRLPRRRVPGRRAAAPSGGGHQPPSGGPVRQRRQRTGQR